VTRLTQTSRYDCDQYLDEKMSPAGGMENLFAVKT
jgi:hypothetical protein